MSELKKILVADDDEEILSACREALTSRGYLVETAVNGLEALDKLAVVTFDLVIADVTMPGLDGIGLYDSIAKSHSYLKDRVVFITGALTGEFASKIVNIGRKFLLKPFRAKDLIAMVNILLDVQPRNAETITAVSAFKRIRISEARAGMYVCGFEKADAVRPVYFTNNILIKTDDDLRRFSECVALYINEVSVSSKSEVIKKISAKEIAPRSLEEHIEISTPHIDKDAQSGRLARKQVEFIEAIGKAISIKEEAIEIIKDSFMSLENRHKLKTEEIFKTVDRMIENILMNPDALLSLSKIKDFDNYTFVHSVNVTIISLAIGLQMGLNKEDLLDLGTGAMLHDVGKISLSKDVLNKPEPLTKKEYDHIKMHPEFGISTLFNADGIKERSKHVVLQHHERYNGTGYPARLSGEAISPFARVVCVADVYDAMTTERSYCKAISPSDYVRNMYKAKGRDFEPEIVDRLIKCIGVYPIGTVVELNTGEIAAVKYVKSAEPLMPVVLILCKKYGEKINGSMPEVDLSVDTERHIKSVLPRHMACDYEDRFTL